MTAPTTPAWPNLAARLRTQSLQTATALFAVVFAIGSALGVRQLVTGGDPMTFAAPLVSMLANTTAWLLARAGRERWARRLFVATMITYLTGLMLFAPLVLKLGLGFAMSMLTVFLFHLVHPAEQASRLGAVVVVVLIAGYATQALFGPGSLDWTDLTTSIAQLLVLAFSTWVLGRLGRGWIHALDEADQARVQLLEAHTLAMQANRAKNTFLASMSHELRTPLNAVLGYAELVQEELDDGVVPRTADVRSIHRAGEHLLGLVNQVLDLSRIEAGKLQLETTEVLLDDLVREVCDTLRPQLLHRQNRLVLDVRPVTESTLDPLRIRQVLTNLLGNATKFTENGTITVRVYPLGQRVRVEIEDDGPGIPAHRLDDIFAPFEQASDDVQGQFGGTGLGLAISRRLTREMGGELWAESTLGEGATFLLELPVRSKTITPAPRLREAAVADRRRA